MYKQRLYFIENIMFIVGDKQMKVIKRRYNLLNYVCIYYYKSSIVLVLPELLLCFLLKVIL